jgi:oxalate decarboxylase/phosphoglucose isomerase-like protein (cupin superfamily)
MKYTITDIGGEVVKDNETYLLKDNKTLNNLVLSSTDLKPNMSTRGHAHVGQEEVYYFVKGYGTMELIDTNGVKTVHKVEPGSVVLIEDGHFHRVHASEQGCYFVCVFDGKRNH